MKTTTNVLDWTVLSQRGKILFAVLKSAVSFNGSLVPEGWGGGVLLQIKQLRTRSHRLVCPEQIRLAQQHMYQHDTSQ